MRWVAIFEDTPAMLAVRAEREPLHLEYLSRHRTEIVLAGGCRPAPGEAFVGGLWVLEVPSRERAVELIEADPADEEFQVAAIPARPNTETDSFGGG